MRADRLLMIMSLLQSQAQLSSRQLAQQLGVSERTVHRDMEALSMAGIPVYAQRGANGGWLLSEGYRSQITGITTDEIRSLLLLHSSSVVKDLNLSNHAQTAFRKLLSALPAAAQRDARFVRERIHVDGAGWHNAPPPNSSQIHTVQEAVWEQRKLRIVYRGWDSDSDTERTVHPLGIVAKLSLWYVVAQTEGELRTFRTFRISRLKHTIKLDETFERPPSFDLAAYWQQSTESFKSSLPRYPAQVRISSSHWGRFIQQRYVKVLSHSALEDGNGVIASVEFQTLESAVEIMLGLGRFAVALAPEQLNHAIYEESKAIASLYQCT